MFIISMRPLGATTQLAPQIYFADTVIRSPHYVHLGHCLPPDSSHLLRFGGKAGYKTQLSCQLSDNNSEVSPNHCFPKMRCYSWQPQIKSKVCLFRSLLRVASPSIMPWIYLLGIDQYTGSLDSTLGVVMFHLRFSNELVSR